MNGIKIGDLVRLKDLPQIEKEFNLPPQPNFLYMVEDIQGDKISLSIDGSNARFVVDAEHFELAEPPDPKTAFLTELAELLCKYDAVINVGWNDFDEDNYPKIDMDIVFGDGSGICFESVLNKSLTPDNIFNYEKE